jgi:hypothetical protein
LFAFCLPVNLPVGLIILGSLVAIGVGKLTFGGLGNNPFNPALVGRVFLFLSFPVQMTTWPVPKGFNTSFADAVTGATPEAIRNEIIEGALYTSHTLWHLCRGKIRDQILNHTVEMLLNEVFMHQLVLSGDIHYIEFALRNLNSFDPSDFHGDIILIIQNNSSLTASRIIEYMPGTLICNNEFNDQLWNLFGDLQYLSQRQFLKKLASCNQLSDKILDELISYSAHSIESQYVQILNTVFNQSDIHMKQEESIVIIARDRKEKLNNGSVQILASLPYHENMYGLRDEVLQILKK